MGIASLPALQGQQWTDYDGRYRVYTVEQLPFDAVPSYRDGGPGTVTCTSWNVSTSSLCQALSSPSVVAADDGMHTLNAYQLDGTTVVRHPLDGTKYATDRAASRAAYEAGLLGFMVYEKRAAGYGLPVAG